MSISSRRGIPANRSPSSAVDWASVTRGIFGRESGESLAWFDPDSCFWRTCQGTFSWASELSSATLRAWGIALRGTCFPRRSLGRLTYGEDSSSSVFLPTPSASQYGSNRGGSSKDAHFRPSLEQLARDKGLPIPTTRDGWDARNASGSNHHTGSTLTDVAFEERADSGERLNPHFSLWMMGFPDGWLDRDAGSSERSETQ